MRHVTLFQSAGDGVGDDCSVDYDGDRIPDTQDACPNNKDTAGTDFRGLQTVILDPYGDSQVDPEWKVYNEVLCCAAFSFSLMLIRPSLPTVRL